MLLWLVLAMVSATIPGCEAPSDSVFIRLKNTSDFDYSGVLVNTAFANVDFGDIASGETTQYKEFSVVYSYAFVQLQADGVTCTLQPIDYVGEKPLKKGYYTYEIDVNDEAGGENRLVLVLVED